MNRVAKSIKLSPIADKVIEQLRIVPGTGRKLTYNSVVEALIEESPKFVKCLPKINK